MRRVPIFIAKEIDAKAHWARIYETLAPTELSWYHEHMRLSLELIQSTRTLEPILGQSWQDQHRE